MNLAVWAPRILSVLRIMTGLLFLEHGTGKLLGFPSSDHTASSLFSLIGFQGVLELAGGLLILLGLFTRPVALFSLAIWPLHTSWRMRRGASTQPSMMVSWRSCSASYSSIWRLPVVANGA